MSLGRTSAVSSPQKGWLKVHKAPNITPPYPYQELSWRRTEVACISTYLIRLLPSDLATRSTADLCLRLQLAWSLDHLSSPEKHCERHWCSRYRDTSCELVNNRLKVCLYPSNICIVLRSSSSSSNNFIYLLWSNEHSSTRCSNHRRYGRRQRSIL